MYINELTDKLERLRVNVKLFDEDAKIYLKIVNDHDVDSLLKAMIKWADLREVMAVNYIDR
jgi:hypothetical protein